MKIQINTEAEVPFGVTASTVRSEVQDALRDLAQSQGVSLAFLDVLVDGEIDDTSSFPSPSMSEVREDLDSIPDFQGETEDKDADPRDYGNTEGEKVAGRSENPLSRILRGFADALEG